MSEKRLLINCSNLHVGGGVAVAASLIDCLGRGPAMGLRVHLLLSSTVAANLQSMGTRLTRFESVEIVDFQGLRSIWQGLSRRFIGYDVIFTVFGPVYSLGMGQRHIVGFAQALILYPPTQAERRMPLLRRGLERLKFMAQEFFFARAHELVVELEHVKAGLERRRLFKGTPIHIVYNTVDSVFREPARWLPVQIPPRSAALRIGVVSRNYPHKNLDCLAALRPALAQRHGMDVDFFVTFNDAEWSGCTEAFRRSVQNVGALTLPQCPSFYTAMDGVIFPSLCESFSASPLEAMLMRKPLFASDLPFIRDCCREHAHYFDPLSLDSMADAIAAYFLCDQLQAQHTALDRAHAFVARYPSPNERAQAYLSIATAARMPQSA